MSMSMCCAVKAGKDQAAFDRNWIHRRNGYMTTVVTYGRGGTMREVQLRDAKSGLSALVDDAVGGEPAIITRHGKREAVLLSYQEWERLSRVPSFGRLLMAAPLSPDDLPPRDTTPLRPSEF
jgi:prevent-host-death family protein